MGVATRPSDMHKHPSIPQNHKPINWENESEVKTRIVVSQPDVKSPSKRVSATKAYADSILRKRIIMDAPLT